MKYLTRDKKVGDILNGVTLVSDDVLYIASGTAGEVRKLRSAMSASDEELVLNVVKEIQRAELLDSHELDLNTAFEYPIGSGDTYSMRHEYMSEFNALVIRNFAFPFPYGGNNGAGIIFSTQIELDAFNAAAELKYNTVRVIDYVPKISQVEAIAIDLPTVTMEQAITQVQAIFY